MSSSLRTRAIHRTPGTSTGHCCAASKLGAVRPGHGPVARRWRWGPWGRVAQRPPDRLRTRHSFECAAGPRHGPARPGRGRVARRRYRRWGPRGRVAQQPPDPLHTSHSFECGTPLPAHGRSTCHALMEYPVRRVPFFWCDVGPQSHGGGGPPRPVTGGGALPGHRVARPG